MEDQTKIPLLVTTGILIGTEIGEWAGFSSGRLTVKRDDGERTEFRFGKESRGVIPKIGSLVAIEHTADVCPEILKIELVDGNGGTLYKEAAEYYGSSLFLGKPNSIAVFVIIEVILGLWTILIGLTWGKTGSMAPLIIGLCGAPHIIIGYLLWNYTGE
ncbi:MAG: hypothetical protein ACW98U_10475 [Candidatus Thorarchaeota archaeon]|jgi:hypothetical protein